MYCNHVFLKKLCHVLLIQHPTLSHTKKSHTWKHAQINLVSNQQPPILWYVLEYHNMKDESQSQTWGY